jgi:AraC-like DNA-binding protein
MTASPEQCADRPSPARDLPEAPHDLLSELLRSVRLSGERIAEYAPAPNFSIGFSGLGSLLFVDEGELALQIEGDPRVRQLGRGDIVLLPRGDAHQISDAGSRLHPSELAGAAGSERPKPARWLCGTFTIGDPQASHLLDSLPPVIVLDSAAGGPAMEGLEVARRMVTFEMQAPTQGSAVMVSRILDLIFIQILRLWAAGGDAEPNWMAGALDPQTGPALSVIHKDPGHDWTVDDLARACNLSRSAFAARFVAHVGKPPATYLAHVRLDAATALLRDTSLPVMRIARNVGYTSEAAFSRAFKSRYGTPPARWRRDVRASRWPAVT